MRRVRQHYRHCTTCVSHSTLESRQNGKTQLKNTKKYSFCGAHSDKCMYIRTAYTYVLRAYELEKQLFWENMSASFLRTKLLVFQLSWFFPKKTCFSICVFSLHGTKLSNTVSWFSHVIAQNCLAQFHWGLPSCPLMRTLSVPWILCTSVALTTVVELFTSMPFGPETCAFATYFESISKAPHITYCE